MSLLDALKRKDEGSVPDVSDMLKKGMSEQDIIDNLRQQGYDNTTIRMALMNASQAQQANQSPPPPQMQEVNQPAQSQNPQQPKISEDTLDAIQGILEQIIEEKWKTATADIETLKNENKRNSDMQRILSEQIERMNQRIDELQNVMVGKTEEYNKALNDVNIELDAFNKVVDKLVPAFSDSIKELRDLIEEFKKAQGQ
ncbi:MAG: hypothetical protein RAK22_01245 [Nanoarchaeota archaeon]|nr:hypothetical protein [Nanoarchaeota archaeon]